MPRKTWDTEQDFLDAYRVRIRDPQHPLFGQFVGYGRIWAQRSVGPMDDNFTRFSQKVERLALGSTALFPINSTDRILISGCGFGYLIDAFHDAGFLNCWGIDNSPYIQSRRPIETRGTTLFIHNDFRGPIQQVKAQMRQLTGDDIFNWIITEGVMESYEDAEMSALLDATERILDPANGPENIVHLVYAVINPTDPDASLDPIYNQKTIAEWKSMRQTHSWVNSINWEVG